MAFTQLIYHVIWATKNREPLITDIIEPILYGFIRSKAIGLGGILYAINGISDHVHLVLSIPVIVPIPNYIGQIKGSSSKRINQTDICDGYFSWKTSYSIFTVSKFHLPVIIGYVENQKEHHREGSIQSKLEIVIKK